MLVESMSPPPSSALLDIARLTNNASSDTPTAASAVATRTTVTVYDVDVAGQQYHGSLDEDDFEAVRSWLVPPGRPPQAASTGVRDEHDPKRGEGSLKQQQQQQQDPRHRRGASTVATITITAPTSSLEKLPPPQQKHQPQKQGLGHDETAPSLDGSNENPPPPPPVSQSVAPYRKLSDGGADGERNGMVTATSSRNSEDDVAAVGRPPQDGQQQQPQPHDHDSNKGGGKRTSNDANSSPAPERRLVKRRRKKPRGMPRRPLSAYNIFFRKERMLIMGDNNPPQNRDVNNDGEGPVAQCTSELDSAQPTTTTRTEAPKSGVGGKLSFEQLGKHIGRRWKALPESERKMYDDLASEDSIRYRKEMDAYHLALQGNKNSNKEQPTRDGTETGTRRSTTNSNNPSVATSKNAFRPIPTAATHHYHGPVELPAGPTPSYRAQTPPMYEATPWRASGTHPPAYHPDASAPPSPVGVYALENAMTLSPATQQSSSSPLSFDASEQQQQQVYYPPVAPPQRQHHRHGRATDGYGQQLLLPPPPPSRRPPSSSATDHHPVVLPPGAHVRLQDPTSEGGQQRFTYRVSYSCYRMSREEAHNYIDSLMLQDMPPQQKFPGQKYN